MELTLWLSSSTRHKPNVFIYSKIYICLFVSILNIDIVFVNMLYLVYVQEC